MRSNKQNLQFHYISIDSQYFTYFASNYYTQKPNMSFHDILTTSAHPNREDTLKLLEHKSRVASKLGF